MLFRQTYRRYRTDARRAQVTVQDERETMKLVTRQAWAGESEWSHQGRETPIPHAAPRQQ
jgi:hypothetical protein